MTGTLPILKVHMLGDFTFEYEDRILGFRRNSQTRVFLFLQMVLLAGDKGVSREELLEKIYGREELANVQNSFRVTVHRVKKLLSAAGLPEEDYIECHGGVYFWKAPMKTEVDALVFRSILAKADEQKRMEDRIACLKEACDLYGGELLPIASGEEWVLLERVQYKHEYTAALTEVCEYLLDRKDFAEALRLAARASEIYPFDDWQVVKVECLVAMDRCREAYQEYEKTAKLVYEELGIRPSGQMMSLVEEINSRINHANRNFSEIQNELVERSEPGAFYCSMPSFRDNYRLVRRLIERNGQSVYLMILSIGEGARGPHEKMEILSQKLHDAIRHSLRRGDSFTRYKTSQFLVLLVGTSLENCDMIFNRIRNAFSREHPSWGKYLDRYVSSIADMEEVL